MNGGLEAGFALATVFFILAKQATGNGDALQVYCASSVCGSISSKSFVNIQPGTLLRFRCRRGSEDVQGKITWIKGGSHLSESDCPSNRIALPCTRRDTGQTLMLRNITKTTSIRCQVGNTTSAQFTVTVIDSLPVAPSPIPSTTPGKMSLSAETSRILRTMDPDPTPSQHAKVGSLPLTGNVLSKGSNSTASLTTRPKPTELNTTQNVDIVILVILIAVGSTIAIVIAAIAVGLCMYKYTRRNSPPLPERQVQGNIGLHNPGDAGEEDSLTGKKSNARGRQRNTTKCAHDGSAVNRSSGDCQRHKYANDRTTRTST